jgi:hypothetical protein
MPVRTLLRRIAFAAMALAAACASAPPAPHGDYERRLDLPADVAAAVAAGALRQLLTFADPVPQAAGAPANPLGGGCYSVDYEAGAAGIWVPRASHRLTLLGGAGTRPATVRGELLQGDLRLPGWGRSATGRLQVQVRHTADGCAVHARLPAPFGAQVAQALDRAFALAADPTAQCVGLAEPNLAAWVCQRSLADARRLLAAGRPAPAEDLLLRAARLRALPSEQHRQLGELAAQNGDLEQARERIGEALLRASDPTTRAHLAARLSSLARSTADQATRARALFVPNAPAELAGAAMRLHTARRQLPEPALDYHLASQLHRHDRDELAAFACALLAREHAPPAATFAGARGEPLRRGLDDFVRRVVRGVEPVTAGLATDTPSQAAAAPAR